MKSESKVSIIVPVYKVEEYLPRCVDSLINQTYKNIEIILVDDGSPDNSPKICDEYASKDSRIRVIHKENAGVSEARNTGIDNAKGDYICFVDSDDYVNAYMVEKLTTSANENNSDMVVVSGYYKAYKDKIVEVRSSNIDKKCNKDFSIFWGDLISHRSACTTLYKRNTIKDIRFNSNLKIAEDFLFVIQAMKKSKTISSVDECLYYYFINDASVMRTIGVSRYQNEIMGLMECRKEFEDDDRVFAISSFDIYMVACGAYLAGFKDIYKEYKYLNTKENYRQYYKNCKSRNAKIKAYLFRHKLLSLYKLIYSSYKKIRLKKEK